MRCSAAGNRRRGEPSPSTCEGPGRPGGDGPWARLSSPVVPRRDSGSRRDGLQRPAFRSADDRGRPVRRRAEGVARVRRAGEEVLGVRGGGPRLLLRRAGRRRLRSPRAGHGPRAPGPEPPLRRALRLPRDRPGRQAPPRGGRPGERGLAASRGRGRRSRPGARPLRLLLGPPGARRESLGRDPGPPLLAPLPRLRRLPRPEDGRGVPGGPGRALEGHLGLPAARRGVVARRRRGRRPLQGRGPPGTDRTGPPQRGLASALPRPRVRGPPRGDRSGRRGGRAGGPAFPGSQHRDDRTALAARGRPPGRPRLPRRGGCARPGRRGRAGGLCPRRLRRERPPGGRLAKAAGGGQRRPRRGAGEGRRRRAPRVRGPAHRPAEPVPGAPAPRRPAFFGEARAGDGRARRRRPVPRGEPGPRERGRRRAPPRRDGASPRGPPGVGLPGTPLGRRVPRRRGRPRGGRGQPAPGPAAPPGVRRALPRRGDGALRHRDGGRRAASRPGR